SGARSGCHKINIYHGPEHLRITKASKGNTSLLCDANWGQDRGAYNALAVKANALSCELDPANALLVNIKPGRASV
ncbi:hypothetical protein ALQ90_02987, partial [Pseudomonas savastanoi pv. savastanoi]